MLRLYDLGSPVPGAVLLEAGIPGRVSDDDSAAVDGVGAVVQARGRRTDEGYLGALKRALATMSKVLFVAYEACHSRTQ